MFLFLSRGDDQTPQLEKERDREKGKGKLAEDRRLEGVCGQQGYFAMCVASNCCQALVAQTFDWFQKKEWPPPYGQSFSDRAAVRRELTFCT